MVRQKAGHPWNVLENLLQCLTVAPEGSPECGLGARLMGSLVLEQPDSATSSPFPPRREEPLLREAPPVMCVSGTL